MKNILEDYYVHKLSNEKILKKYELTPKRKTSTAERIYEHFKKYSYSDIECEFCRVGLKSNFVGKNAQVSASPLVLNIANEPLKELTSFPLKKSQSRNYFQTLEGYKVDIPHCLICGHEASPWCDCENCFSIRNLNFDKVIEVIKNDLKQRHETSIDSLKLFEIYELLILIYRLNIVSNIQQALFKIEEILSLVSLGLLRIIDDSISYCVEFISVNEYIVDFNKINVEINSQTSIQNVTTQLRERNINILGKQEDALDIEAIWLELTTEESLTVLEYYCQRHNIYFCPGEKTVAVIQRSLKRYGLAQTARYICNSVRFARTIASESGAGTRKAFNYIYGNLNFWLEDDRARSYNAPPFARRDGMLAETFEVTIFQSEFLDSREINYFKDPVSVKGY